MALPRLIYLLKTVIAVIVINYSCVLCMEEISRWTHGKSLPLHRNTKRSASAIGQPDIFSNFTSLVGDGINMTWNLQRSITKDNSSSEDSTRKLKIFLNNNSVSESNPISIDMKNSCKVNDVLPNKNVTCSYHYRPIVNCTDYKLVLGHKKNTAEVPAGPIVHGSVIFMPTHGEDNPVKIIWKIGCNATDCMNPVSVSFVRNESRINFTVEAVYNSTEKTCEAYLGKDQVFPCIPDTINIGHEKGLLDIETYYATNVVVWSEKQSTSGEGDTAVISWNAPVCQISQIIGWQILIRGVQSKSEVVKNISNPVYRFEFVVKPCEMYLITIRTQYENGGDRYSTAEKSFEAKCPIRFLAPISAIAILLVIAVIIALFFLRMRRSKRREAVKNQTELNNTRSPTTENRNRISSTSRNRLSSFNRNRISSNSRNSSNGNAENDLDTLPQMRKRPLTVRDLCSFEIGQARKEFFLINKLTEVEVKRLARTTAEQPENKIKNRFLNTHPYDFNRVVLSHHEERQNDSYINASFIPGFGDTENEYIAAQGPKDNTVGDFWRMIWEQKVQLIAMVTSLHECGKKKCEKYWPDKDDSVVYGDFQLELLDECVYSFFTSRKMRISKSPQSGRDVQQFHFTAWPDFETPEEPEQIIRFIEIVRRGARQLNFSSPIVVHCSAGVGRTGTFIALDYLIQQVLITDVVDVPKTVRHLRRFRLSMVQSEAQYVFLYTCIAHYVKSRLATTIGKM